MSRLRFQRTLSCLQRLGRRQRWAFVAVAAVWAALGVSIALRTTPAPVPGDRLPTTRAVAAENGPTVGTRLQVTVVGPAERPLHGATVTTATSGEAVLSASTNEQGLATITGLPQGLTSVTVSHNGFARQRRPAHIDGPTTTIRLKLLEGAELQGLVRDTGGTAIEGAWVHVRPALDESTPPWTTRTDSTGRFRFSTLRVDEALRLQAGAPGYATVGRRTRAGVDEVQLALQQTGELTGHVVDHSGAQRDGVEVVLAGSGVWPPRAAITGADGAFRFAGVPGGIYELRASDGREVAQPREGLSLSPGASAAVTLRLQPGHTMSGVVVDAVTEQPIANAEVVIREEALSFTPRVTTTDEAGQFTIEGLLDVEHRTMVHATGKVSIVGRLWTPSDGDIRFELEPAATLTGIVVNEHDEPVVGATISIVADSTQPTLVRGSAVPFRTALFQAQLSGVLSVETSGELGVTFGGVPPLPLDGLHESDADVTKSSFITDSAGAFRIEGVAAGDLELLAHHPAHAPGRSEPLRVVAGATVDGIRIKLPLGAVIDGRVVDARGFPVGHVRVELAAEHEPFARSVLADSGGGFRFTGALDTIVLTAFPPEHPPVRKTLTAVSGQGLDIKLTLEAELYTLRMRAVDPKGFPVPDAVVDVRSLRATSPVRRTAVSAQDGTLEVGALPPAPWRVEASHPEFAVTRPLDVSSAEQELRIEFGRALTVVGRLIQSHSSDPLVGAAVTTVAAGGAQVAATTDVDGRFELARVPAGPHELDLSHPSIVQTRHPVALPDNKHVDRLDLGDLELQTASSVTGHVVDALGDPVAGAQVVIGDAQDWRAAKRTERSGRFELTGIAPGYVRIRARHPAAGESAPTSIRVTAAEVASDVRIRLPERFNPEHAPSPPRRGASSLLTVRDRGENVVVASLASASARRAGLRVGDRIVSVDDERVINAAHARGMLRRPKGIETILEIERRGRTRRVLVSGAR